MSYKLKVEKKGSILLVKASGKRTLKTVMDMSTDIKAKCSQQDTVNVLADIKDLKGRLSFISAFYLLTKFFPLVRDRDIVHRCAIVDLKGFEYTSKIFGEIAEKCDLRLRIFSSTDKAMEWLQQ